MSGLSYIESIPSALRSLYDQFGYTRYKMNKFEEYDLYAKNKDFLISGEVIAFTDTSGRLMALKPDVTLSIVKNTRDNPGTIQKLYYTENVYRVSKYTHTFKEIPQMGLEAIGQIDEYCIYEVLKLAAQSMSCTGRNCILEISHLGLLAEVMDYAGIPQNERSAVTACIGEKNLHELSRICAALEIPEEKTQLLRKVASLYGDIRQALPELQSLLSGIVDEKTLGSFVRIVSALDSCKFGQMFRIDFSAVSDLRYYNGFVFKGFAEGVPASILSGGQYDTLMRKMKRQSGAIGFAVYLDLLEQYSRSTAEYDVDTLLIYDENDSIEEIEALAKELGQNGKSILVQRSIPEGIRYREIVKGGKHNA